jgi:hypothetical protein
MKINFSLFLLIIWFLFSGEMVPAQQEKNQGEVGTSGQSGREDKFYSVGKEHYLPDSPFYRAGKKHYLQEKNPPAGGKIGQGDEKPTVVKDEMAPGEGKNTDDQRIIQIQIDIHNVAEEPPKDYGIIYMPMILPKHPKGPGNPPPQFAPHSPQTGNANPSGKGGFHQGPNFPR